MPIKRSKYHLECSIMVKAPIDRAFKLFTESFGHWWPRAYTWAGESLQNIGIEPSEGGLCFEIGPHGFHCDWGTVQTLDPPHKLVFLWQISPQRVPVPDPEKASEVEIQFIDKDSSTTQLKLIHRNFERHGDESSQYCKALASQQGWPYILDQYSSYLQS